MLLKMMISVWGNIWFVLMNYDYDFCSGIIIDHLLLILSHVLLLTHLVLLTHLLLLTPLLLLTHLLLLSHVLLLTHLLLLTHVLLLSHSPRGEAAKRRSGGRSPSGK